LTRAVPPRDVPWMRRRRWPNPNFHDFAESRSDACIHQNGDRAPVAFQNIFILRVGREKPQHIQ
jgi:hypothetical protein